MDHLKNNWNKTHDEILRTMMDLQLQGPNGLDVNREERVKYSEYLTETIRNMALHVNEQSNRCRYSPHIINISLSLYLRSKKSYRELRESRLLKLPSPTTMKSITS